MKGKIVRYLIELISYLDGRGLIVTDEGLLKETLRFDFGMFRRLRRIIRGESD